MTRTEIIILYDVIASSVMGLWGEDDRSECEVSVRWVPQKYEKRGTLC